MTICCANLVVITILCVFADVTECQIAGEVVYKSALCDGNWDCTDGSDESIFSNCET